MEIVGINRLLHGIVTFGMNHVYFVHIKGMLGLNVKPIFNITKI